MKFYRHRPSYWSCSKLSKKILGTPKPSSATFEEWREWRRVSKKTRPIRYWIAEELLNRLQDIWLFPSDCWQSIRIYFNNRFLQKTHALEASKKHLTRGVWYELDDKILPCLFDEFVKFVDNEISLKALVESSTMNIETGPWVNARREMLLLYWWWTEARPSRVAANYNLILFFAEMREKYRSFDHFNYIDKMTPEEITRREQLLQQETEQEAQYENEDTIMLTRLIRIRKHFWS